MKQIVYNKTGNPIEVTELIDYSFAELPADMVRIKIHFANILYADLASIRGVYGSNASLPAGAGSEGIGTIVELAPGIENLKIGDKVIFHSAFGSWSSHTITRFTSVVAIPESLDEQLAAQLYTSALTAETMLNSSGAKEGDVIVVNAAASSTGRLLLQFAVAIGVKAIAIVRNEKMRANLLDFGASLVINEEKENVIRKIKSFTNEAGANYAFDAVAGKSASDLIFSLAPDGKFISYGVLSGERIPVNAQLLITKNITMSSFWYQRWFEANGKPDPVFYTRYRKQLIEKIMTKGIKLPIDSIYPIDEFQTALQRFEEKGRTGKILLSMQDM